MVLKKIVLVVFICMTAAVPASAAGEKDVVVWMEAVAPPFFIHEGVLAGQGYEDVVTDIVTGELPQYEHERVIANITRHYREFKDGRKACNIGLFKTPEREKFLYYSIPSFFTLPAVLIIDKNKFEQFGGTKTVKLEAVLKKNLRIGRSANRSYGKPIDNALDTYGNETNIFQYEGGELSLNFFEMIKHDRLDALIGLPEEAMYQAERLGMRDTIMTLTIEENQSSYEAWFSYVACSKNEWGKAMISQINEVLLEQRPTPQYRGAYERWIDESTVPRYRELYDEVFLGVTE